MRSPPLRVTRSPRPLSRRRFLRHAATGLAAAAALALGLPPSPARAAGGPTVDLLTGWNAKVWWGRRAEAAPALADLPISAAFAWDVGERRWLAHLPDSPVHDFDTLEHAMPLWLRARRPASWQQAPFPAGLPDDVALPVGWSLVSWIGERAPVWDVLGDDFRSPIRQATRWNPSEQQFFTYRPGFAAEELFAILHPGNVFWLQTIVSDVVWNPAFGLASDPYAGSRIVDGEATFYHPSLHGNAMFCGGLYDRTDPTIAAATGWPCGTRLRVWRDDRSIDVVVQDTGLLASNQIDLSEAAFQQLGDFAEGRIPVRIEALPSPSEG